ncbi:MAG: YpzG family protein [Tuberibacillus sp.]
MDKWHEIKQESTYTDPFQSPRANPKHAYRQINGETQQTLQGQLRRVRARQQNMYL